MTRYKAALIHLFLSILVIGFFCWIVFFLWYPKPLYSIAHVMEPLKLLVIIGIIVGPMLTLLVFSTKKKAALLRSDLTVIIVLQLLTLGYGIYTIYLGRPSIIAFADGKLHYLVEKFANNQDLTYEELLPEVFSKPKLAYIPQLKTLDIYSSYANLEPLTDKSVLKPYALSVKNMKAKFTSKIDDIDVLLNTYPEDDIKFFLLDKDGDTSFVVFSMKEYKIIDELKY